MAPKLNRGAKLLFAFLQHKKAGDEVTAKELLAAMNWKESTLKTYVTKHMLNSFLIPIDGRKRFRVVKDGSVVTPDEIMSSFSQVKPSALQLTKRDELTGKLSSYLLTEEIGTGAVGHVWRAVRRSDKATVAVKIVNPRPDLLKPSVFPNVKKRFAREGKNGMQLNHGNVVDILDTGDFRQHPFIVMPVATGSLGKTLSAGTTFSASESIPVMKQVLQGIEYLHSEGHIHRDIKPDNILQFGTRYVVGDLGIVKWSDLHPAFISAGTLTRDSVQLGSWFYMAPEQLRQPSRVTPAVDIYGAGVSWHEVLTGDHLSPAEFASQTFADPSAVPWINALIRSMVQFDPVTRPTVSDVLRAFPS